MRHSWSTIKQVIKMIQQMREEVTVDGVMTKLYFHQKVDLGFKELNEGKDISHEEVKEGLKKWLN